jgi:hypothetical protein
MAYITGVKTQLGVRRNPSMAAFSSRGPNTLEPTILKVTIIINQFVSYVIKNLDVII